MTLAEKKAGLDGTVRDLWARGGPMLASSPTGRRTVAPEKAVEKSAPSPALLREQRRLIKTWGKE
jgi:hypothetical protein